MRNDPDQHDFQGRLDRDCEICKQPDRSPVHKRKTPEQASYDAVMDALQAQSQEQKQEDNA